MAKQITVRGVSEELANRLSALSNDRGLSLNATVLELLNQAVGLEERRQRLERYATWSSADLAEVEAEVKAQRTIDASLWR